MSQIQPHEELLAAGALTIYEAWRCVAVEGVQIHMGFQHLSGRECMALISDDHCPNTKHVFLHVTMMFPGSVRSVPIPGPFKRPLPVLGDH